MPKKPSQSVEHLNLVVTVKDGSPRNVHLEQKGLSKLKQIDDQRKLLQHLDNDLLETHLNVKQAENKINQLKTCGRDRREKIVEAEKKLSDFQKRLQKLEKEVKRSVGRIQKIIHDFDPVDEFEDLKGVFKVMKAQKAKEQEMGIEKSPAEKKKQEIMKVETKARTEDDNMKKRVESYRKTLESSKENQYEDFFMKMQDLKPAGYSPVSPAPSFDSFKPMRAPYQPPAASYTNGPSFVSNLSPILEIPPIPEISPLLVKNAQGIYTLRDPMDQSSQHQNIGFSSRFSDVSTQATASLFHKNLVLQEIQRVQNSDSRYFPTSKMFNGHHQLMQDYSSDSVDSKKLSSLPKLTKPPGF